MRETSFVALLVLSCALAVVGFSARAGSGKPAPATRQIASTQETIEPALARGEVIISKEVRVGPEIFIEGEAAQYLFDSLKDASGNVIGNASWRGSENGLRCYRLGDNGKVRCQATLWTLDGSASLNGLSDH